jgi:membrane protease YdiL (CAAX protease family)
MSTKMQRILAKSWKRILISIAALLIASFFGQLFIFLQYKLFQSSDLLDFTSIGSVLYSAVSMLSIVAVSGLVESLRVNSSFTLFGIQFDKHILNELKYATIGIAAVLLCFVGLFFGFGASFDTVFVFHKYYLSTTIVIFCYAATEELIFRGILFQALVDKIGGIYSTLILSTLFALGHIMNPGMTLIAFSNVLLAGVLFSVMYLKTKSLWLPIFFHFFWNYSTVAILDTPVSGMSSFESLSIFDWTIPSSSVSNLILGGNFGIEGGLATTILLILMAWVSWKYLPESKNIARKIELRKQSELELLEGAKNES